MKLICKICGLALSTQISNESEAITDLLSLLKSHVRFKHKDDNKEYEEHLQELVDSFANLPSYLFLSYFVNLEHSDTNDRVGVVMEELGETLAPIEELFKDGDYEEEEIEEENKEEEVIESNLVNIDSNSSNPT